MADLPEQGLLQQRNAQPVSGEHLEILGKRASVMWSEGHFDNLNEAVVATVKKAGLSPEQVRRVIEFANTDAYLREFRKEGSHRVVEFPLADPSVIFQDLNDGGGGTVFDKGDGDYSTPPTKKASADLSIFEEAFASSGRDYPSADPLKEVSDLRDKVASAYDLLTSEVDSLEISFQDVSDRLFHTVKQACLSGASLHDVVEVMAVAKPDLEHIKIAFDCLTPRLLENRVFSSVEDVKSSFQPVKTASPRTVNPNHPLVGLFSEYCQTVNKLASSRMAREEFGEQLEELTSFITKSAKSVAQVALDAGEAAKDFKGIIPTITGTAKNWGEKVAPVVSDGVKRLTGRDDWAKAVGGAAGQAVRFAPHAGAVVGANELRRQLKYSPTYQKMVGMTVPLSTAYDQREAEIAARYGRYPE